MDKSPSAFRTISEVSSELDVPKHVLRFWESKFTQIKPMKLGGGRRYYRPEDLDLLRGIRGLLYDRGYTIKGVQRILKEHGVRFVKDFSKTGESEPVKPAKRPVIPDVAAEAAAGRARKGADKAAADLDDQKSLRKECPDNLTSAQRKMLLGVLKELEECRDRLAEPLPS